MEQYLLQIKSECMGTGNEELGKMLTRSFLNNLINQKRLPSHIILYNSGVLLASEGRDTANALKELEQKGVEILMCGTCIDFYQLKDEVNIGQVSNMINITSQLISASKIITL
jgi:selenium metabolism protein YedF